MSKLSRELKELTLDMEKFDTPEEFFDAMERDWKNQSWYDSMWYEITYKFSSAITFFKETGRSLRNFWRFKGVIWKFRDWAIGYNIDILAKSLEYTRDGVRNDIIYQEYLDPKVKQIDRFIWLSKNYENGMELIDEDKGIDYTIFRNTATPEQLKEYANLTDKLEDAMWVEMWTILLGSGAEPTNKIVQDDGEEFTLNITDGTDARRWYS